MNKKLFINELVRQTFHLLCGIIGIINIYTSFVGIEILLGLMIIAIVIFLALNYIKVIRKYISEYLSKIERSKTLAGQGVLTLYTSFFILSLISHYSPDNLTTSLVAMSILTFSDSTSTIIGITTKRFILPYNKKKNLIGVIAGVISGSLAASLFIHPLLAILVSSVTMFFESLDIRVKNIKIDDNLLVPFIAFVTTFIILLV